MHNASGGRAAFFFITIRWARESSKGEPGKCAGMAWFAWSDLPDAMIVDCCVALGPSESGHLYSEYGW